MEVIDYYALVAFGAASTVFFAYLVACVVHLIRKDPGRTEGTAPTPDPAPEWTEAEQKLLVSMVESDALRESLKKVLVERDAAERSLRDEVERLRFNATVRGAEDVKRERATKDAFHRVEAERDEWKGRALAAENVAGLKAAAKAVLEIPRLGPGNPFQHIPPMPDHRTQAPDFVLVHHESYPVVGDVVSVTDSTAEHSRILHEVVDGVVRERNPVAWRGRVISVERAGFDFAFKAEVVDNQHPLVPEPCRIVRQVYAFDSWRVVERGS